MNVADFSFETLVAAAQYACVTNSPDNKFENREAVYSVAVNVMMKHLGVPGEAWLCRSTALFEDNKIMFVVRIGDRYMGSSGEITKSKGRSLMRLLMLTRKLPPPLPALRPQDIEFSCLPIPERAISASPNVEMERVQNRWLAYMVEMQAQALDTAIAVSNAPVLRPRL